MRRFIRWWDCWCCCAGCWRLLRGQSTSNTVPAIATHVCITCTINTVGSSLYPPRSCLSICFISKITHKKFMNGFRWNFLVAVWILVHSGSLSRIHH